MVEHFYHLGWNGDPERIKLECSSLIRSELWDRNIAHPTLIGAVL